MIITKTPFRMSFFGGGTDIPEFFNSYGGSVISTTFDKYCYVNVRHLPPFFNYTSEIVYSQLERVIAQKDIEHPLVRNAMKFLDMHELRITYEADLPAKTGLGTSSSFAVGLLNAFYALKGKYTDKRRLAEEAIYLERTLCNENGGWQDQIAASYGGFNRINFSSGGYDVQKIIISPLRKKQLNDNLLLFFTGFTRFSSEIQKDMTATLKDRVSQLQHMTSLVDQAEQVLTDDKSDLDDFGRLLNETWQLKRGISAKVSTDVIDELYSKAINFGALGGKLLGAGGGGFLLFYVNKTNREAVLHAMRDLLYVPFEFENGGTRVVYYSPEFYNPEERREK